jgi:hypothetical protein
MTRHNEFLGYWLLLFTVTQHANKRYHFIITYITLAVLALHAVYSQTVDRLENTSSYCYTHIHCCENISTSHCTAIVAYVTPRFCISRHHVTI